MFCWLYYSATINESKEKFTKVFCCSSVIENIFASSSLYNFPVKLFVVINLYQCVYNIFDDANNLINFLWYNHCLLTFWLVFCTLLVCFLLANQKVVCYQLMPGKSLFALIACNTHQNNLLYDHHHNFWMKEQTIYQCF